MLELFPIPGDQVAENDVLEFLAGREREADSGTGADFKKLAAWNEICGKSTSGSLNFIRKRVVA